MIPALARGAIDLATSPLNGGRLDMANEEYVVMQSIGHDRREFISKSFCLAGTASLAAFGVRRAVAQAQGTLPPIQRSQRYDDSFITQRKPFKWPATIRLRSGSRPMWKSGSTTPPSAWVSAPILPITCRTSSTTHGGNMGCASGYGVLLMSSMPPALRRPSH